MHACVLSYIRSRRSLCTGVLYARSLSLSLSLSPHICICMRTLSAHLVGAIRSKTFCVGFVLVLLCGSCLETQRDATGPLLRFSSVAMEVDSDEEVVLLDKPRKRPASAKAGACQPAVKRLKAKAPKAKTKADDMPCMGPGRGVIRWLPADPSLTTQPITVGTHFSGWETVVQSLLAQRIPHLHKFSADTEEACRAFISKNFTPELLYSDVHSMDFKDLPQDLDLYVSGSPCPSFSGRVRDAKGDKDERGALIYQFPKFLKENQPKAGLLENVAALRTRHDEVFKRVMSQIKEAGYTATWKLMNTREHGVPQCRNRIYVAAIRNDCFNKDRPFAWPKRLEPAQNLSDFLEPWRKRNESSKANLKGATAARNVELAESYLKNASRKDVVWLLVFLPPWVAFSCSAICPLRFSSDAFRNSNAFMCCCFASSENRKRKCAD